MPETGTVTFFSRDLMLSRTAGRVWRKKLLTGVGTLSAEPARHRYGVVVLAMMVALAELIFRHRY